MDRKLGYSHSAATFMVHTSIYNGLTHLGQEQNVNERKCSQYILICTLVILNAAWINVHFFIVLIVECVVCIRSDFIFCLICKHMFYEHEEKGIMSRFGLSSL